MITPSGGNVFADLALPDADHLLRIADLTIEVGRLRAIEAAAEANHAAWLAWRNWRPDAGMGHGHADRYMETRDALWVALGKESQP